MLDLAQVVQDPGRISHPRCLHGQCPLVTSYQTIKLLTNNIKTTHKISSDINIYNRHGLPKNELKCCTRFPFFLGLSFAFTSPGQSCCTSRCTKAAVPIRHGLGNNTVDGNQKSCKTRLLSLVYPHYLQGFLPGRWLGMGFLNHQQYRVVMVLNPENIMRKSNWIISPIWNWQTKNLWNHHQGMILFGFLFASMWFHLHTYCIGIYKTPRKWIPGSIALKDYMLVYTWCTMCKLARACI